MTWTWEKIEHSFDLIMALATAAVEGGRQVGCAAFIFCGNGEVTPLFFQEHSDMDDFLDDVRFNLTDREAEAAIMVSEAYVLETTREDAGALAAYIAMNGHLPPREAEVKYLVVHIELRDGIRQFRQARITGELRQPRTVGEWQIHELAPDEEGDRLFVR